MKYLGEHRYSLGWRKATNNFNKQAQPLIAFSGLLITIESLRRAQPRRTYAATFLLPLPRRFHERNFGSKFEQQRAIKN
jgi:hypothetical protein